MGGPNLEVVKFSIYLFVPIFALVHFGDPDWYKRNVLPYRDQLFPAEERTVTHLPTDQSAIREELDRFRAEKVARRVAREAANSRVV